MVIKFSEAIAIADIVINAILIIGLATYIQKTQINTRTLKDYFIKEIDKLHQELGELLDTLEDGFIKPKDVQSNFFRLINKTNSICQLIDNKYNGINASSLVPNILLLQQIIENDSIYQTHFYYNFTMSFGSTTIDDVRDFRANNTSRYHLIIVNINDYNKYKI